MQMIELNVRPYNNKEMLLFPACIGDYLHKEHLAWIIDEVTEQLDLSALYNRISCVGNPSYHPKMMLKVLFYAYTQKVFSSRKIEQKLETDVAFIFLAGMQKPDFRTISDFRKNNLDEISSLFIQIVRLCKEIGLIELGHISVDSTVIKANASKEQFYTKDRLDKEEQLINNKIKELLTKAQDIDDQEDQKFGKENRGNEIPKELESRKARLEKLKDAKKRLEEEQLKKINLTDQDVTFQKSHGQLVPGYRAQIVVDEKEQIIVACEVDSNKDNSQLIPMLEKTFKNTEKSVNDSVIVTADSGYSSMENLKEIKESPHKIDAYIPDNEYQAKERNKKTEEDSSFHKNKFQYDQSRDVYICPNNKELRFIGKRTDDTGNRFSYYRCKDCQGCKHFGICTKSPKGRGIKVYENEYLIYKMRKKLDIPEGKLIYKERKVIVESVHGNIKHNLGFREFLLRGKDKVRAEFSLIAIAHNLLKIAKFIRVQMEFITADRYLIPVPSG